MRNYCLRLAIERFFVAGWGWEGGLGETLRQ
jgi:hypothetical protein